MKVWCLRLRFFGLSFYMVLGPTSQITACNHAGCGCRLQEKA